MSANARTVGIGVRPGDPQVAYCRRWGLVLVIGSLASWALVIVAARLIVSVV